MRVIKQRQELEVGPQKLSAKAFTLIELLVVIAIIALLVAVSVPSYEAFRKRGEKAVCISQMRILHSALDSYMLDNKHWPQMPDNVFGAKKETDFWKWWILTLDPYGGGEAFWLCPSDKVRKEAKTEYNGSYMPAQFDSHNFTPYRWAGQPWLIERGNLHRKGAHIMMPDGSIHSSQDVY